MEGRLNLEGRLRAGVLDIDLPMAGPFI